MWIERLTSSRTTKALELAAQFGEQRQRVLAENLANVDTPDYQTQRLDPAAFRKSLQAALKRSTDDRSNGLDLRDNAQFATGPDGRIRVAPVREPADNVLFHDGTNVRLEQLMADISQNALSYELSMNLLRGRHQALLQAIRGRTT